VTTLPEGMTKEKSNYGTTYRYKGVRVTKNYRGFTFREEVIVFETGKEWIQDSYPTYYLRTMPETIEKKLKDEGYYVDALGNFRLTETRKAEIRKAQIERTEGELSRLREKVTEALTAEDYAKVSGFAQQAHKLAERLAIYKEKLETANA